MKYTLRNSNRIRLSLLLKLLVAVSALTGTFMSAYAGRHSFMGGNTVFMYFTIQSNLALALICLIGGGLLVRGREISRGWSVVKLVGTVSITLTGAVFCFVLAPTMGGAAWGTANVLTHVVVPVASVVDFLVMSPELRLKKGNVIYVILPPLAYAVYAGIGYALGWEFAPGINYPYFFLNWGSPAGAFGFSDQLPFMGCGWWILALLVLLMAVGRLYQALAARIARNQS